MKPSAAESNRSGSGPKVFQPSHTTTKTVSQMMNVGVPKKRATPSE